GRCGGQRRRGGRRIERKRGGAGIGRGCRGVERRARERGGIGPRGERPKSERHRGEGRNEGSAQEEAGEQRQGQGQSQGGGEVRGGHLRVVAPRRWRTWTIIRGRLCSDRRRRSE